MLIWYFLLHYDDYDQLFSIDFINFKRDSNNAICMMSLATILNSNNVVTVRVCVTRGEHWDERVPAASSVLPVLSPR